MFSAQLSRMKSGIDAADFGLSLLDTTGLRLVEQVSTLAGYESIPFTPRRLVYRPTYARQMRNYDVLNRFAF